MNAHTAVEASIGIQSIPSELLSTIFEDAALSWDDNHTINHRLLPALLRTCTSFRRAACHTPFLWSFITFECRMPSREIGTTDADIVSDYGPIALRLRLIGAIDFKLQVFLEGGVDRTQDIHLALRMFKLFIGPHLARCYQLEAFEYTLPPLTYPSPEMPSFFPLDGTLSALRHVVFRGVLRHKALFSPTLLAPALKCVNSVDAWIDLRQTWTYDLSGLANITLLNLRHTLSCPMSDLPYAASLARLRFLRIESPWHVLLINELEFPHLEVLALRRGRYAYVPSNETLPHITAPELRHLQIECHISEPLPQCFVALRFPHLLSVQYYHPSGHHRPLPYGFDSIIQSISDHHILHSLALPADSRSEGWIRSLCDRLLAGPSGPSANRYMPDLRTLQFSVGELGVREYQYVRWLKNVLEARPQLQVNFICRNADVQLPSSEMENAIVDVTSRWNWTDEQDFVDRFFKH